MGHLQEEQEGDLLRVGHVRQPVVPEDVGEVPRLVDDLLGRVAAHFSPPIRPGPSSRCPLCPERATPRPRGPHRLLARMRRSPPR